MCASLVFDHRRWLRRRVSTTARAETALWLEAVRFSLEWRKRVAVGGCATDCRLRRRMWALEVPGSVGGA